MTGRSAALVGAAIVGAVLTVALGGGASAPATAAPPPLSTARVIRTDLRITVLTGATLQYAPAGVLVNHLTGTYTKLPALGSRIAPGGVLYRVDDVPIALMVGATPAWRPFALGMTDGPDVIELQANLISLGDARGLFSQPSGYFDVPTWVAVERWQRSLGELETGQIELGQIAFLPNAVRVGAPTFAAGQAASPGQLPFQVTTSSRHVIVPLNPNLPPVSLGATVSIVLPSGGRVPGRVTAIGTVPAGAGAAAGAAGATALTVVPRRPIQVGAGTNLPVEVALTSQSVRHTLAAPIAALLALAGGGYGLEVVERTRLHRLVGVKTGVFAGSEVQISGAGIGPGTKVVVAQ